MSTKPNIRLIVVVAACWQVIVYAPPVAGIFGDIHALLGIPWNSLGIINVVGNDSGACAS